MGHLSRAGLIILGVVALVFVAPRLMPLPEVMQDYGFYFGQDDAEVWATRAPHFADSGSCENCHADNFAAWQSAEHRGVNCESCHGPARDHIDAREALQVRGSREFCGNCHGRLISRPADFLQVTLRSHNAGQEYATCHDPHRPGFNGDTPATVTGSLPPTAGDGGWEPTPPRVPHSLEGRADCMACHQAGGFKPRPEDHAGRTSETCLSCHRGGT